MEDYYADIVVLADGVNSFLSHKIGLREDFKPKEPERREIRFKSNRGGKLAEVFVTEKCK